MNIISSEFFKTICFELFLIGLTFKFALLNKYEITKWNIYLISILIWSNNNKIYVISYICLHYFELCLKVIHSIIIWQIIQVKSVFWICENFFKLEDKYFLHLKTKLSLLCLFVWTVTVVNMLQLLCGSRILLLLWRRVLANNRPTVCKIADPRLQKVENHLSMFPVENGMYIIYSCFTRLHKTIQSMVYEQCFFNLQFNNYILEKYKFDAFYKVSLQYIFWWSLYKYFHQWSKLMYFHVCFLVANYLQDLLTLKVNSDKIILFRLFIKSFKVHPF